MKNREENFLHPKVSESTGLKEHVYYEISREKFYRNCLLYTSDAADE